MLFGQILEPVVVEIAAQPNRPQNKDRPVGHPGTAKVCTGGSVDVLSDCIEQFIAQFGLAVNVLQPFEDGNDLVATRCVEPDLKDRRTIEPTLGIKGDSHRALPRRFLAQNAQNDHGLESAKPDLQSTFKKPGGDTAAP